MFTITTLRTSKPISSSLIRRSQARTEESYCRLIQLSWYNEHFSRAAPHAAASG